jgi:glycine/D-amino acid oxidase-like deaminating enzyme
VTRAPDVVVIGGGIVGASAASFLARAGAHVMLVEREALAAGASGRNSGVVQHPFDPVLADLHLETVRLYRELAAAGRPSRFRIPHRPSGLLYVAADAARVASLADRLIEDQPDLDPTYLAPGDVTRLEPALRPEIAGCRLAIGYPVAPAAATLAYAEDARRAGAIIEIGVDARPWLDRRGVAGVRVGDRTVPAGAVVVTAGPWSPEVVDPAGRWRPIGRSWGVVVDVGLPAPPRHVLEELDVEAAIEPDGGGVGGLGFSLVPADGSSSLGSTFLPRRPDPEAVVPALRERGSRFVPAIAIARRGVVRVCARPVSRDGRPLVGMLPWQPGLFLAAGHGPWGISTGPASGRLVADLVLGRVRRPPRELEPGRFGEPA